MEQSLPNIPPRPSRDNVMVVVVTYHPDQALLERTKALSSTYARVLIIDNTGCHSDAIEAITEADIENVEIIKKPKNIGIAAAMNEGIETSIRVGFHWTLTLDQDSALSERALDETARTYDLIKEKSLIALIGCNYKDLFGSVPDHRDKALHSDGFIIAPVFISSGSLLNNNAFRKCGMFDEDYFIDYVDNEYCLRARRYGYTVYITRRILMTHPVGHRTRHSMGGRNVYTSNHVAFRRYFMARNRLLTIRKHFFFDPSWCSHQLLVGLVEFVKVAFLESSRKPKLCAIASGYWDAIRSRYPEPAKILAHYQGSPSTQDPCVKAS